jgi:hypothetical protein
VSDSITHHNRDSTAETFKFKMAGAVDSWLASLPTSLQVHFPIFGPKNLSDLRTWSSTIESTITCAQSTDIAIWANAYVALRITPGFSSLIKDETPVTKKVSNSL